ncbi:MAG TPA: 50S ribosomal protein L4 [Thermodesulfovibrionales bacterium]|nr:50S ribosomal protein L4 [Thermodesulfovibrionales bacterium]
MPETELKDVNNKIKGSVTLPEELFGLSAREDILHASVRNFLANQRQGTHATKTKGLVRGGGKKPWKQKHTGRARAGSIRSPLWRGGGTIFGPQPRDYSYRLPRIMKRRAVGEALSAKLSSGEMTVVDVIAIEKPRTREMVGILKTLGLEGKSVLVVLPEKDENILLSARNIPGVKVSRAADLNPYQILSRQAVLITKGALDVLSAAEMERGA